jgi:hypothetical protein
MTNKEMKELTAAVNKQAFLPNAYELICALKAANAEKDAVITNLLKYHDPEVITNRMMLKGRYPDVARPLIADIVNDVCKIIEG